ncbi:hypothetical protein DXG01_010590 [Tephrocybe rancida]|nr:hypothetical protein DXG01_010590 [Tephrocybe rancida]
MVKSSVADVSSKIGEYMLKGWVLTDQSCKSPGCSVPLMRSPNGRIPIVHLCVDCDDASGESRINPAMTASDSASSAASDSNFSRPSTPPTEISSTLSSPVFAPPADTEESRRRREQSDTASAEIGKRLLKGWAMLGDECPNIRCYGVPLVRPPKAGGEKDPRKECVICGGVYLTETDWAGRERLVLTNSEISQPNNSSTATILLPAETNQTQHEAQSHIQSSHVSTSGTLAQPTAVTPTLRLQHENKVTDSPGLQALEKSATALQSSLLALSARLTTISGPQALIDPSSIGVTADAISKVTQALTYVRQLQLQWGESHTQGL